MPHFSSTRRSASNAATRPPKQPRQTLHYPFPPRPTSFPPPPREGHIPLCPTYASNKVNFRFSVLVRKHSAPDLRVAGRGARLTARGSATVIIQKQSNYRIPFSVGGLVWFDSNFIDDFFETQLQLYLFPQHSTGAPDSSFLPSISTYNSNAQRTASLIAATADGSKRPRFSISS